MLQFRFGGEHSNVPYFFDRAIWPSEEKNIRLSNSRILLSGNRQQIYKFGDEQTSKNTSKDGGSGVQLKISWDVMSGCMIQIYISSFNSFDKKIESVRLLFALLQEGISTNISISH